MGKQYQIKTTWDGDPDFHQPLFGSGTYVTVNDEEYLVTKVISPSKYAIKKEGLFGGGEELILEKCWSGWQVREQGWFE